MKIDHLKMGIKVIIIFSLTAFLLTDWCMAQVNSTYMSKAKFSLIKVGDTVPNINFRKGKNFPITKTSIKDYLGKVVIIDFWSTGCPSCIRGFPKMEALQREFSNDIQIILVNPWESEEKIMKRLVSLRGYNLNTSSILPIIFGDTIWRKVFPHQFVPHHVWIDKNGRLLANTNGISTNATNIRKILNGESVQFLEKNDIIENKHSKSFYSNSKHKSSFSPYNPGLPAGRSERIDTNNRTYNLILRNESISRLYDLAVPMVHSRIIYETKRMDNYLSPNYEDDFWLTQNLYTYEITISLTAKDSCNNYMFLDLNKYFGAEKLIEGIIEVRKYDVYILTNMPNPKLTLAPDKTQPKSIKHSDQLISYTNYPYATLLAIIKTKLNIDYNFGKIFQDESRISSSDLVSFIVPKGEFNLTQFNSYLNKLGLNLSKVEQETKVLVIKDI